MQWNKWNYESVKNYIESLGFILISKEFKNIREKLLYKDKENYFYMATLDALKVNKKSYKFHKSNPYVIQNIKLWLKLNGKLYELLSDKYENNNKYLRFKCLKEDCEEIFEAKWSKIISNRGCPFCAGKQVGLSNCLD